jgi:peptide/nickel transport system substrate-binding protein
MTRRWTALLTALSLVFTAGLSSAAPSNEELKIGVDQEFENMNPIISQMLATTYIYALVGRRLVVLGRDGKTWEPQLVTKIPTFENGGARFVGNSPKKLVADWEIDPKAVWGDGTPITGADVKFAWEVALSPSVSVGEKDVYAQVEKVDIDPQNPKRFTFTYKTPRWDFNRLGTFFVIPKHIEEAPFKKFSKEKAGYEKNSVYTKDPLNKGLYSGPYLVSELKLGSHVTVTANPKWWGKKPKIEKIVIKLIPSNNTLEANLRSGTIDMVGPLGFTLDQAIAFEKTAKSDRLPVKVNFKASLTYEHIDLNLRNEILSDVRVRKALVYAINRDELTKALFDNRQTKAVHMITPNDPWYTDDGSKITLYPSSRRQAEKLLDEAGWVKKEDGLRYKNGKKLSLSFMTTAGNKVRELVQVFLQEQWKKAGIEVVIKNEPPRVFFGETVRKGLYSAMAMFAWVSSPENSPKSQLHSKNIPTKANGNSGQNSGGYSNPELDQILDNLDEEFDAKKRLELVQKILKFYTEDVPVIPLYYRSDITVTPEKLKGYTLPGHQFSETNWAEEWSI